MDEKGETGGGMPDVSLVMKAPGKVRRACTWKHMCGCRPDPRPSLSLPLSLSLCVCTRMRVQDGGVMTAVLAGTEGIVTSDERDNIKAPGWDGGIGDATGGDGPASLFGVPKGFRLASAGSPTRAGSSNNASTSGNPGLLSKLTGYSNSAVNWQGVQERLSIGDTVGAFAHVVDRGELADLARMMEVRPI